MSVVGGGVDQNIFLGPVGVGDQSLDDLANGGFVGVFFTHGMVLVLWEVDVILGNGY